jgi:hypothetical protein
VIVISAHDNPRERKRALLILGEVKAEFATEGSLGGFVDATTLPKKTGSHYKSMGRRDRVT